jgi:hypothetical protein
MKMHRPSRCIFLIAYSPLPMLHGERRLPHASWREIFLNLSTIDSISPNERCEVRLTVPTSVRRVIEPVLVTLHKGEGRLARRAACIRFRQISRGTGPSLRSGFRQQARTPAMRLKFGAKRHKKALASLRGLKLELQPMNYIPG